MLLAQTLIQIVAAGGGVIINLEKNPLLAQTMIQIAATAAQSGAIIIFKLGNTALLSQTMIQIAAAGKGHVIFDLN